MGMSEAVWLGQQLTAPQQQQLTQNCMVPLKGVYDLSREEDQISKTSDANSTGPGGWRKLEKDSSKIAKGRPDRSGTDSDLRGH